MDWGGFLVVGRGCWVGVRVVFVTGTESDVVVKSFEKWDVSKVYVLVHSITFPESAEAVLVSRPWYR